MKFKYRWGLFYLNKITYGRGLAQLNLVSQRRDDESAMMVVLGRVVHPPA